MLPDDKSDRSRRNPISSLRNRAHDSSLGSRWRNRSTTNLREADSRPQTPSLGHPATMPVSKFERSSSKMSLFNLFNRPKVERARGHTEVGLAVPMQPQTPQTPLSPVSVSKSSLRQNPSSPAQQTLRARSSQMFRPMSMRPATPYNEFGNWDPPPLFQAFTNSLKHATVQACVFPPEVLMRTQSQRRHAEMLMARMDSARDLSTIDEDGKLERTHRRLISNSVLNPPTPELVNKIYILVSDGYVLQYAGEGPFDRTPEKVLPLGKESAAFACDLIPGKHWVLQISSHANDGTIEPGPRSTLLSRLRSQNTTTKRTATSFLLVLESAEEMDEWMTTVRKEIDGLGGMKIKDESVRASSSTDGSMEKKSTEITSHRYLVQRDPSITSKIAPVDSPLQSYYSGSPKIITTDWETNGSERTLSIAESSSGQSSRGGNNRQSIDTSSVASTPVSQHQLHLDQLRGRSRYSVMSTATSTSGPGTQNTSREPSPAPQSPLKEDFMLAEESEPPRSAMTLKSFHMNPTNGSASRRRSMQPLPVTNENAPPALEIPVQNQRHSLASPTSPTVPELGKPFDGGPAPLSNNPASPKNTNTTVSDQGHIASPVQAREDSPVRLNAHSYGDLRRNNISPPPKEPAPLPPQPAQRQSVMGSLLTPTTNTALHASVSPAARIQRRVSATPSPFLRPFPVRPQAQHGDSSRIVPRRQSSLTPTSAPAPLPLGINVNRSFTAPPRSPSAAANMTPASNPSTFHSSQTLRRPVSVQIHSDPAPFLSSSRRMRIVSSTPSFVPSRRLSNAPTSTPRSGPLQPTPSIDTLRQQALAHQNQQKGVAPRRSMPALGLPPPAPPPNMPLPPPPCTSPPPTIPLPAPPAPPPTTRLPSPPPTASLPGVAM